MKTQKVIVYRIEHEFSGKGPYTGTDENEIHNMLESHCYGHLKEHEKRKHYHKAIFEIVNYNSKYFCGFISMDKLDMWFPRWMMKTLLKYGYVVVKYLVDPHDIITDGKQVGFVMERAIKLNV